MVYREQHWMLPYVIDFSDGEVLQVLGSPKRLQLFNAYTFKNS